MGQEYLRAAKAYFMEDNRRNVIAAEAIEGVWVASDVETIVEEARAQVSQFFPAVQPEHVVCVSFGEEGEPETVGPTVDRRDQVCISLLL